MNRIYLLSMMVGTLFLVSGTIAQSKPLQTQMTMDGMLDVDISKAKVDGNILMVVLTYLNAGNKDANIKYAVKNVYFIDKHNSLKVHVLRDSKKDWLAAPVARGSIAREAGISAKPIIVKAGGRATVWFRFPAPLATTTSIDLIVPGILPFDNLAITK